MVLSLNRWVGKVVIITGASSGIGEATAKRLVKGGLMVAGLARRVEKIEEIAATLENEKGKLYPFKCDIRNENEVVETFKLINETIGPIQILINNAGLSQKSALIDGDVEKWKTMIDTNFIGLSVATREAVRYMKESNVEGHIIHLNSVLGHRILPIPELNFYGATKYAVTALAAALRKETVAQGLPIRVTSISPGAVTTEFAQVAFGTSLEMPCLEAEDIADAIIYAIATPQRVNVNELELQHSLAVE